MMEPTTVGRCTAGSKIQTVETLYCGVSWFGLAGDGQVDWSLREAAYERYRYAWVRDMV